MKLVKKGFLSCSTSRVSAMASVLGTSRGSGGLSSQLRCKSKRRRRRRSKRKGKDAVPGAGAGCPCELSSGLWAPLFPAAPLPCRLLAGHQRRAERSEFRYLCKWLGASASPEGTVNGGEGSAECWLGASGGRREGQSTGRSSDGSLGPSRSLLGHRTASDPLGSNTGQRKHSLTPASLETREETSRASV